MNSSDLKKQWIRTALEEGNQGVKVILDTTKVGPPEQSGLPQDIYRVFEKGIPLDLMPHMPLKLDYDSDPDAMLLDLSIGTMVGRCRIPWKSIAVLGIGIAGVGWAHDTAEEAKIIAPRPGLKLV